MNTKKQTIEVFDFKRQQLRTIIKENNIPWFMAKDIGNILGIKNTTDLVASLDLDEKEKISIFDVRLNLRTNFDIKPDIESKGGIKKPV